MDFVNYVKSLPSGTIFTAALPGAEPFGRIVFSVNEGGELEVEETRNGLPCLVNYSPAKFNYLDVNSLTVRHGPAFMAPLSSTAIAPQISSHGDVPFRSGPDGRRPLVGSTSALAGSL